MCANGSKDEVLGQQAYAAAGRIARDASVGISAKQKCLVAGCTHCAGEGHMELVIVCSPCARMLQQGMPAPPGKTFIHALQNRLEVTARVRIIEKAQLLLDRESHRSGFELSSSARNVAMAAVTAALKEVGVYDGQEQSPKNDA